MDEDLRAELNRLWTDLRVTQLLLTHIAAKEMTQARIDQWHDRRHADFEARADWSEAYRENMARALDQLTPLLRISRAAREDRDPPPGP